MDTPKLIVETYVSPPHRPTLDVSTVRPLDARASLRCPVCIQHDIDPPADASPVPLSDFEERLMEAGHAFEARTVAELIGKQAVAVTDDLVSSTVGAMENGVPVIVGGALPTDAAWCRTGRPDILVRSLCVPRERPSWRPSR